MSPTTITTLWRGQRVQKGDNLSLQGPPALTLPHKPKDHHQNPRSSASVGMEPKEAPYHPNSRLNSLSWVMLANQHPSPYLADGCRILQYDGGEEWGEERSYLVSLREDLPPSCWGCPLSAPGPVEAGWSHFWVLCQKKYCEDDAPKTKEWYALSTVDQMDFSTATFHCHFSFHSKKCFCSWRNTV